MAREEEDTVHQSRQALLSSSRPKPSKPKKPHHSQPAVPKRQAHVSSVNGVKKRIRDITRKLNHGDALPADVRQENERALVAYEQELAAAAELKHKNKMISKYKMVRFFDNRKAARNLKKLKRTLGETEDADERERLEKEVHVAEVDLNYTHYFPLNEPYISVHPKNGSKPERDLQDPSSPPSSARPPLWAEIEKRMEQGMHALQQLRDGTRIERFLPPKRQPPKPSAAKPRHAAEKKSDPPAPIEPDYSLNRRERRKAMGISQKKPSDRFGGPSANEIAVDVDGGGDENMSDGGFFEE